VVYRTLQLPTQRSVRGAPLQSRYPNVVTHFRRTGTPPAHVPVGRDLPPSDADTVNFEGATEIPTADLDSMDQQLGTLDSERSGEDSVPLPYSRRRQPPEEGSAQVVDSRTGSQKATLELAIELDARAATAESNGELSPNRPQADGDEHAISAPKPASAPRPTSPAIIATPAPRDVTTGTVLRDRYVIEHVIGIGGNSVVFQAVDRHRNSAEEQGERVALKVLRPQLRDNPYALMRMRREFRQMQRLTHSGVARVFDLDCDGDVWFMTLELVAGQTITRWMKGPSPDAEALQIITGCCEAVSYAHSHGIVHGDLKPSNVLVTPDLKVKLVDFGSAAAESSGAAIAVSARSFAATPPYASPQILTGNLADPRDDVFSLACIAYAVLTRGEHPFERKSSLDAYREQMRPTYSSRIQPRVFDVIVRGLSWQRDNRPASVAEFLNALIGNDLGRELEPLRRDPSVATAPPQQSLAALASQYPVSPGSIDSVPVTLDIPPSRRSSLHGQWLAVQPWSGAADMRSPGTAVTIMLGEGSHAQLSGTSIAWSGAPLVAVARPERPTIEGELLVRSVVPSAMKRVAQPPPHATIWHRHGLAAVAVIGVLSILLGHESDVGSSTTAATAMPAAAPIPASPVDTIANTAPIRETTEASPIPPQPNIVEHVVPPPPTPVAPGFVSFDTPTIHVGSGQSMAVLTVKRLDSTRGRARIGWAIEGPSASAVVDSSAIESQTIQFLDGQEVRSLYIPLRTPNDPGNHQPTRSFTVKLRKLDGSPAIGPLTQTKIMIASGY
jgi:serine/threonine protein kinase